MMTPALPTIVFLGALGLIATGLYGFLAMRNLIKVIIAQQILIKGVLLAFILAGNLRGEVNLSQAMGLTIIVADTIVAVIAIGLAVQIRRQTGTLDVHALTRLRK